MSVLRRTGLGGPSLRMRFVGEQRQGQQHVLCAGLRWTKDVLKLPEVPAPPDLTRALFRAV